MEQSQGRRRERPADRERQAEQAVERGEARPVDAPMRQAYLRAVRQEQAARLAGKLAMQDETQTQPPRQP